MVMTYAVCVLNVPAEKLSAVGIWITIATLKTNEKTAAFSRFRLRMSRISDILAYWIDSQQYRYYFQIPRRWLW